MNNRARLFLAFGLLLSLLVGATPTGQAAASREVRVGVYQNEPKIFIDEDGQAAGLFIELLEKIAAEEGWTLTYLPCEWEACLQALEEGQIDLMPDVAWSEEREQRFDFHQTPVLESWSRVYAAPGSSIRSLTDLDGKRVAVLEGSIQEQVFTQLMSGFGYDATLVPANSLTEAFGLASTGQAGAAIANHLFGDYFHHQYGLQKTSIEFNPTKLYYAVAEGRNADLLEGIESRLTEWIPQPGSAYYTTLGHWSDVSLFYRTPPYLYWTLGVLAFLALALAGLTLAQRRQLVARTRRLWLARTALRESEARYETLAAISPVGIFRTDANGHTTYVNPAWSAMSGLSYAQAMGEGWMKAVHPEDREGLRCEWQEVVEKGGMAFSDYRFLHPDGTIVWVLGQAVPERDEQGQILGYVGTITDITIRKQAEEEMILYNTELERRVAERTQELDLALQKAQEADRLKSAFLATMSHELRTPLNSIIGFTGILLQGLAGPLEAEQIKQLGMIRDSAQHLLALINDVLDISKIEAGQLEVRCDPFDLREAIESALRMVTPLAQKKGLSLSAVVASGVGTICSDQRRVEQILINLLNNAVKFTEGGEVRLECETRPGGVEICVRDTGLGIRPEDMEKIFRPFQQLETGLARRHEGTGLGLAICQSLATLLGGEMRAESEWGQGSAFTVALPLGLQGG
ncbi:MAG: ATP-binding protein [Chloroflexota bacterium]